MATDEKPEQIFEITDYQGTSVVLSKTTWHTKAGDETTEGTHPEIRDYLEDITHAIECPDIVFQSNSDLRSRIFYKLDAGRGDFEGKHLVVIVKYIEESDELIGYVSTMYISRSIYSKGVLLWTKKNR